VLLFVLLFNPIAGLSEAASFRIEVGDIAEPSIIPRAAWGARPPRGMYTPHAPNRITVHHTATPNVYGDAAEVVRAIQRYHMDERGFIDIGYHYLIDREGRIYEGRPEGVVGAHVAGQNTGNIGVTIIGNYEEADVTPASQAALEALLAWLCYKHGIPVDAIKGHRDYAPTTCPGKYLYARLPEIKESVRARLMGEYEKAAPTRPESRSPPV